MMRTTSKEVHNSLVFTGVNHLIIKHDQIPFVHIKIGIPLQSRRYSLDDFNVWHGNKGDFGLIGPLEITLRMRFTTHSRQDGCWQEWNSRSVFFTKTKRNDQLFFFLLFLDANFLLEVAFLMAGNGGLYFLQAWRKLFFNMRRACKRLLSHVGEKTANLKKCPGVA